MKNLVFSARLYITLALLLITAIPMANAESMFNFDQSTPVGSWQEREETTTNHKGKQTLTVVKTSLLGEESYQGAKHFWLEIETKNYKLKNGKRKPVGKPLTIKSLVDASVTTANATNVISNVNKYGRILIMQNGDEDPMLIDTNSLVGKAMLQQLGTKTEYHFAKAGKAAADTPSGKVQCTQYNGSGSAEMNLVIKKIRVVSEMQTCVSDKIPFGVVSYTTNATINGKKTVSEAVVVDYGSTGAVSRITKEAKPLT